MRFLFVLLPLVFAVPAFAVSAYDLAIQQRNAANNGFTTTVIPQTTTNSLVFFDAAGKVPALATLGTGLSISGGVLNVSGAVGPQGPAGTDGADGKSAYELAVETGFVGTELQWLASLKGETGATGATGATGPQGPAGAGLTTIGSASRSFGSAFTVSATRPAFVAYTVAMSITNPLLAGSSSASVDLQYSTNGGTSWVTVGSVSAGLGVGLAVSVSLSNTVEAVVAGFVPAGAQVRMVSAVSGTGSTAYVTGQEVLF